jgi:hypothetical protein
VTWVEKRERGIDIRGQGGQAVARTSQRQRGDQLQKVGFVILAGVGVEHLGAEKQAQSDAVVGAGRGRFHLAVLEGNPGVTGLFLENFDEIGTAVATGLKNALGFGNIHGSNLIPEGQSSRQWRANLHDIL